MNMRLLGATSIKDIRPDMVDASNLSAHVAAIPGDRLYDTNCKIFSFYMFS
jgi:L-lactate dehydrogenase (cytochrome)